VAYWYHIDCSVLVALQSFCLRLLSLLLLISSATAVGTTETVDVFYQEMKYVMLLTF